MSFHNSSGRQPVPQAQGHNMLDLAHSPYYIEPRSRRRNYAVFVRGRGGETELRDERTTEQKVADMSAWLDEYLDDRRRRGIRPAGTYYAGDEDC